MIELTCGECDRIVVVTLTTVGDDVVARKHHTTECRCIDSLTADELLLTIEDAYSMEDWVAQADL